MARRYQREEINNGEADRERKNGRKKEKLGQAKKQTARTRTTEEKRERHICVGLCYLGEPGL